MYTAVRVFLTLVVVAAAAFLGYEMASYYLYSPWTRDARIRADVVTVAPDVSGYVTDVNVRNNQFVRKGDILFKIEQDRYRLALANAEASLAGQYAQRQMLQEQLERRVKAMEEASPGRELINAVMRTRWYKRQIDQGRSVR